MPTPTVINNYRYSDTIRRQAWDQNYFFDPMCNNCVSTALVGGAAVSTTGHVNIFWTGYNQFEQYNVVTNANIVPQLDGSFGLNLAPDAVSTHSVEYDKGITPQNPYTFLIDTSGNTTPAFFMKGVFQISTVAGCTLLMGFRKLAARNATLTSYTDFATIQSIAGEFETETQIASAGAVTTDLSLAATNATAFEIMVLVDCKGNVTYSVNGVTPSAAVAYQFANNTTVIPFMRITQNATTTATASSNYWEVGYQS